MTDIADLSAVDLAAAIRAKTISPVEAVEAALARIEEKAGLNAFMAICADRARAGKACGARWLRAGGRRRGDAISHFCSGEQGLR